MEWIIAVYTFFILSATMCKSGVEGPFMSIRTKVKLVRMFNACPTQDSALPCRA